MKLLAGTMMAVHGFILLLLTVGTFLDWGTAATRSEANLKTAAVFLLAAILWQVTAIKEK